MICESNVRILPTVYRLELFVAMPLAATLAVLGYTKKLYINVDEYEIRFDIISVENRITVCHGYSFSNIYEVHEFY
jgi:hypothetical protein